MFLLQQPIVRTAEIFSPMPDAFRKKDTASVWADANRGGVRIDSFLEGPVFDNEGNLFVTDIPFGRIFRIDPQGQWTLIAEYDGEPNGMKFLSRSHLLIADYRNGLVRLDIATGKVEPFLERRNTERFKGINDLVFDSTGNLYFTDQGQTGMSDPTGRVFRLSPSGRLDALITNGPSPNGLVLSPDEKVLYVAMTRANSVWRIPLFADGSVGKVGQFFTSYGPSGPDGLAMDAEGRLIVANPGLGHAWVLNHRGEPVEVIRSPLGASLTNVAFGGANRTTAFFTESVSGTVLRADMSAPGCPIHRLKQAA
ncbi:SMP-30/gluconolactonase/LRE family protein [Noviherbaspirillum malthae]|uniref:SMP-30/gluconolactonase/LRE family protein n=1 Tax=Noviherbaspirillum malthae TaxID=1260987 RepID=UPI00188E88B8|nr:SMP-30/gluconolactonase/LRE family protein [Noviherbaspirillum malthae]